MSRDRELELARGELRELWVAPHAFVRISEVMRRLFPRADFAISYDCSPRGALRQVACTYQGGLLHSAAFRGRVTSLRQFRLDAPDPFANRAVTTGELFAGRAADLEQVRTRLWRPLGQHFQLRVALFEGGSFSALVALLKDRAGGDFSATEAARLDSIVPDLRELISAARALGPVPAAASLAGQLLDAYPSPAFLTTPAGALVYANHRARAAYPRRPEWLSAVLRAPARHTAMASVTRVEHEGKSLFLVLPRRVPAPARGPALSPRLAKVADLAAQGLSDKEIADALQMPRSTARTYVRRIYAALGVRSRVALRAAWLSEGEAQWSNND